MVGAFVHTDGKGGAGDGECLSVSRFQVVESDPQCSFFRQFDPASEFRGIPQVPREIRVGTGVPRFRSEQSGAVLDR